MGEVQGEIKWEKSVKKKDMERRWEGARDKLKACPRVMMSSEQ